MKTITSLIVVFAVTSSGLALEDAARTGDKPTAEQLAFFETKIRPVLADKCYRCHSEKAEKLRGKLLLDTRDGTRRGGDNGPAVVPGNLKESLLIDAIRYSDPDTAMPPEKAGGKLPDSVIADFEKWILMGAPDPREGAAKMVAAPDLNEARNWWVYQPLRKPAVPAVQNAAWPRGDIDRFVLAELEAKGLKPVPDAGRLTLLRRLFFDLTGLPPGPEDIKSFLRDNSPAAVAKLVDRLLAAPEFGERWGRHWLDVARYAESSGKDVNLAYPHAWRFRDYVIDSFNRGKPFDQFVREQLAGDLLPARDDREKAEHLVATGFLAIGPKSHNEQNPRQFYLDLADEQIDAMSQAFLGLTIACARCHDHKFEPIPQRDYYALAGIFLSTDTRWGTASGIQNRHPTELLDLPATASLPVIPRTMTAEERAQKQKTLDSLRGDLEQSIRERFLAKGKGEGKGTDPQRFLREAAISGFLEADLKAFGEDGRAKALAMGVQELPASASGIYGRAFARFGGSGNPAASFRERLRARPPEFASIGDARLYTRGDVEKPAGPVPRGVPGILCGDQNLSIPAGQSGRRELADWLVSSSNPLTARVFVNRVWHWLFGQGIVSSCDNFGTTGSKPVNPALLDALATRFVDGGWNVKALIREIVLSHTYALSSASDAANFQADPGNSLVWRANKRRLDAECLRDAMLFASGNLHLGSHLASIVGENGEGPIGGPRPGKPANARGFFGKVRPPGTDEEAIINAAGNYRSVYLPIARDVLPDMLAVFDFPEPSLVTGARETTNVPSQALFLLNSAFASSQAQRLGARICAAYPAGPDAAAAANLEQRVNLAYWLTVTRAPDPKERQASIAFFQRAQTAALAANPAEATQAAWTSFCRALFASAEFRYLD